MSSQDTSEKLWLDDTLRTLTSNLLASAMVLLAGILSLVCYCFELNAFAVNAAVLFNAGLLLLCGPHTMGNLLSKRNLHSKKIHFLTGGLASAGCVYACSQLMENYLWIVSSVFVWCGFLMLWTFSQFEYWRPRRLLVSRRFFMIVFLGAGACAPIAAGLAPTGAFVAGWILSALMGVGVLVQCTAVWYFTRYAMALCPEQHADVWPYLLAKDSWFAQPNVYDLHVTIRVAMTDDKLGDAVHDNMFRKMDMRTAQCFLDQLEYCEDTNSQLICAAQKRLCNMQEKTLAQALAYLNQYGTPRYLNSARLRKLVDAAQQHVCLLEPRAQVVFAVYPDVKAAVQEIERMLMPQEVPPTLALPEHLELPS